MDRYPAIAEHGLIGDLQTAALVSTDGTSTGSAARGSTRPASSPPCSTTTGRPLPARPRGDDCVVQAALLPRHRHPDDPVHDRRRRGRGDRLHAGRPTSAGDRPATGWSAWCGASAARCASCSSARRASTTAAQSTSSSSTEHGAVFRAPGPAARPCMAPDVGRWSATSRRRTRQALDAAGRRGRRRGAGVGRTATPRIVPPMGCRHVRSRPRVLAALAGQSTYRGRWREMVHRSAITLKLLTYAPTGALVAAPTAACPSRSAASATGTTATPGSATRRCRCAPCSASASPRRPPAFVHWLRDRVDEQAATSREPLQIMYRVDGSPDLPEEILDHFEGYRGSEPVRIGNGAADQLQLDIYGEALYAVCLADRSGVQVGYARVDRARPGRWTGSPTTGTSPTRASGRPAAAGRTSPTAG